MYDIPFTIHIYVCVLTVILEHGSNYTVKGIIILAIVDWIAIGLRLLFNL